MGAIPQPLLHSTRAYLTFKTLDQAWRDDIFEMLTGNWYFPVDAFPLLGEQGLGAGMGSRSQRQEESLPGF